MLYYFVEKSENKGIFMKITYLNHSGFLVELKECYMIFDYWRYGLPPMDTSKQVVVFASHAHPDHYNPDIFRLLSEKGFLPENITAILGKDIAEKKYPDSQLVSTIIKARRYEDFEINHLHIKTLQSTDAGVAYYITTPEGSFYHAGDLNEWIRETSKTETPEKLQSLNKQMTGNYHHEINLLKDWTGGKLDYAFLPLDPLLGPANYCYSGILYFLKNITVKKAYPMHYWNSPSIINKFVTAYPEYKTIIQNTEAARDFS